MANERMNNLMVDPMFNVGMGLMAQPHRDQYGNRIRGAVGRGLMGGMQMQQNAEQIQAEQAQAQAAQARARIVQERQDLLFQQGQQDRQGKMNARPKPIKDVNGRWRDPMTGKVIFPDVQPNAGNVARGPLPAGSHYDPETNRIVPTPGAQEIMEKNAEIRKKGLSTSYDWFSDKTGNVHSLAKGMPVPKGWRLASQAGNVLLSKEEIDQAARQRNLTKKNPIKGRGKDAVATKIAVEKEAINQQLKAGASAGDVYAMQARGEGLVASLKQQEKAIGSMRSFIGNVDKQVARVHELAPAFEKAGVKILNIPLRKINSQLIGLADQKILEMYLEEISTETGKIASGSTQSVAQLGEGAREKWSSIHDPDMPLGQLLKLMTETKHAGHIRMNENYAARDTTMKEIRELDMAKGTPTEGKPKRKQAGGEKGWSIKKVTK